MVTTIHEYNTMDMNTIPRYWTIYLCVVRDQMGSYDCGIHTLSNSMYMTALAYTWGGTPQALLREDGNGRFRIY